MFEKISINDRSNLRSRPDYVLGVVEQVIRIHRMGRMNKMDDEEPADAMIGFGSSINCQGFDDV